MIQEEKITLQTDTGESVDFYVMVTDSGEDEDGECYILKDVSCQEDQDAVYEFVENDSELEYLFGIFTELLDGSGVEIQR